MFRPTDGGKKIATYAMINQIFRSYSLKWLMLLYFNISLIFTNRGTCMPWDEHEDVGVDSSTRRSTMVLTRRGAALVTLLRCHHPSPIMRPEYSSRRRRGATNMGGGYLIRNLMVQHSSSGPASPNETQFWVGKYYIWRIDRAILSLYIIEWFYVKFLVVMSR